ncbi:MAG: hypothetical protein Q9160_000481 [Pyrenula sp. 1 TL-2023]
MDSTISGEATSSLRHTFEELDVKSWAQKGQAHLSSPEQQLSRIHSQNQRLRRAEAASRIVLKKYSPKPPRTSGCPFTQHTSLENDFTTIGTRGSLGCPFATNGANGLPTPPGNPYSAENERSDPIEAEFHRDIVSTSSYSNTNTNPNKCPIRFLDQHSPEEVAQYFENHKHEIPRSHEVCVKRYQKNSDSIRQLDAKYGNLVSMIQGLGVKHKQYLPDGDLNEIEDKSEEDGGQDSRSVKQWAEDVSHGPSVPASSEHQVAPSHVETDKYVNDEDPRIPHFERPLREVRVGESPSRPWGISVPLPAEGADGTETRHEGASSIPAPVPVDLQNRPQAGRKSPVGQVRRSASSQGPESHQIDRSQSRGFKDRHPMPKPTPQMMVFHGPVFFGYSSEEVTKLLQSGAM